jgi:predicted DNA-binding protein (MmcQ/YjbR family)
MDVVMTIRKTQATAAGSDPAQALRRFALRYPEAQEGVSCSKSAFRAGDKAFLFVAMEDHPHTAMVKLRESQAEAATLASKEPGRYTVGAHGWVTVTFSDDEPPPLDVLERWIDESYRVVVNKRLVAMLPERGLPTAKTTVKKRSAAR